MNPQSAAIASIVSSGCFSSICRASSNCILRIYSINVFPVTTLIASERIFLLVPNAATSSLSYRKAHTVTFRITGTETDVTNSDDFSGSFTLTYNPTTNAWSMPSGATISNNSFILTAKDGSNSNALNLYCTISWQ